MADTNETIADIIAEMREIRVREFQDYADRLEAALKCERGNFAALHEALAEARRFVWTSAHRTDRDLLVTDDGKRGPYVLTPKETLIKIDAALSAPATAKKSSVDGDSAKLREALETMNNLFERGVICTSYANSAEEMEQIEELYRKTKSALAAPARNCDRFATLPDALAAWRDIDPREAGPFDLWLFAPATEQEGGAE